MTGKERPQPFDPFGFTEREQLWDRISDERFRALIEDEATKIHRIDIDSNSYGEFAFVTLSREIQGQRVTVRFWGLGYHEHRERWITAHWNWYRGNQYPAVLRQTMTVGEAQELLEQRRAEIAPYVTEETQTARARLYEMLADLTDEDGALAELDDLGDVMVSWTAMRSEISLQTDMFTGALVDARTREQKRGDRQRTSLQQLGMFSARETVRLGECCRPWLRDLPRPVLELEILDLRTDEEKERDLQRQAEALTVPMFSVEPVLEPDPPPVTPVRPDRESLRAICPDLAAPIAALHDDEVAWLEEQVNAALQAVYAAVLRTTLSAYLRQRGTQS